MASDGVSIVRVTRRADIAAAKASPPARMIPGGSIAAGDPPRSAHAASHTPKMHTPVTSPVTYGCARRRAACEMRDPRCEHPRLWSRGAAGVDDVGDVVRAVARETVRRPPPAAVVASVASDVGHRDPAFAHLQRRLAVVVSPARRGTRSRRRQADGQRSYARAGRRVPVGGDRGDDVMREVGVIYEQ